MFVEDVTIDGFKSYAQRVTVPGFDRHALRGAKTDLGRERVPGRRCRG